MKEIYLGSDRKLLAPLFVYRIVIDEQAERAAAFVGVKNPHLIKDDLHININIVVI